MFKIFIENNSYLNDFDYNESQPLYEKEWESCWIYNYQLLKKEKNKFNKYKLTMDAQF